MASRTLYHFTSLSHLADIYDKGLTVGDLAGTNRGDVVSLTKSPEPTFSFWGGRFVGMVDKLKIRITATVDEGPALMRWRDALSKHGARASVQKQLDPTGDGHNWFCHFGPIPTTALSFEIRNGATYEPLAGDALTDLVEQVREESKKWIITREGFYTYAKLAPGIDDSFLLDGPNRENYLANRWAT